MISVRFMIEINSKITFFIGGILNVLLTWLVYKKTPKQMQIYSKILLQVCFSDLVNLLINDAVQPLLLVSKGVVIAVSCGYAGALPYPWNVIVYFLWLYFSYFAMIGIVVQFAYRYLILCKGHKDSSLMYFSMVAIACLIELFLFGYIWILAHPPTDEKVEAPEILSLLGHSQNISEIYNNPKSIPNELRLTLHGQSDSVQWIILHFFFASIPIAGYAFVIYSGMSMMRFVDENAKCPSANGRQLTKDELNRQITRNLMVQACIPLIAIFCWGACAYVCVFGRIMNVDWFNQFSSFTATPVQSWISVFNPLASILTVMPYRRAVFGCRSYGSGVPSISTVA